ncbi:MAG: hypothetical protein ACRET0_04940 [Steroidobacteraceae bacterium]
MKAMIGMAAAYGLAALAGGPALAQSGDSADAPLEAPPLQAVLVTARGIEPELPQQLALYGTRVDTVSAAQI